MKGKENSKNSALENTISFSKEEVITLWEIQLLFSEKMI